MNVFGTEMHVVTFIFTIIEVIVFFMVGIYYFSRPRDKSYKWYLILLSLLIVYNITGGLFPDENINIPINVQLIVAYGSGFFMAMYFPFYFYKAWDLKKLKFHAYYGVILFLFIPYLLFFVAFYLFSDNIEIARKVGVVVPFFYSLSLFYSLTQSILDKYKSGKSKEDILEIIGVYLAVIPWMSLTIVTYYNAPQVIEVSFTNAGLVVASLIFIMQIIRRGREEQERLIKSNAEIVKSKAEIENLNVTLQKLNENLFEKVKERTKQLEEIIEQKTNIFQNLAHETKTPITLINNYFEYFLSKQYKTEEEIPEELRIIKTNFDKLGNDVTNFFDLEKINKGFDTYNHNQVCDFSDILKECCKLFKVYSAKKNVLLKENIVENIFIKADPHSIQRIINNLIENAIKFSEGEGDVVDVDLKLAEGTIIFSVSDNGIGIPTEMQPKIFEPYYQVKTEKKNNQGLGLGLAMVKKIIDELKGEINVISCPEQKQGTDILIKLSAHKRETRDIISEFCLDPKYHYVEVLNEYEEDYDENKKTILVVEDNISMLNSVSNTLKTKYNIFIARNGLEALKKLKIIRTPDLIVSDVMMDKMDGYTFAKALSQDKTFYYIPFIFLTAKSSQNDKLEGLKLGAIDFIEKPFSLAQLSQKIDSLIEHGTKQRQAIIEKLETAFRTIAIKENIPVTSSLKPLEDQSRGFEEKCEKYKLTDREVQIVRLIAEGHTYKKIAELLYVALPTVKKHTQNILEKVGAENKIEMLNKLDL